MEFISIIKTPNIDKAILVQSDSVTLEGTLCITTHYLLFSSRKNPDDEVWVGHFDRLDFEPDHFGLNSIF